MAMLSLRLALAELNQPGRWARWQLRCPCDDPPAVGAAAAFAACAIFATGVAPVQQQ